MPTDENARQACLRVLRRPGGGWWTAVVLLSAVVAFGLYQWVRQLTVGMGAAGYNDHAFWAVYIADVITFIGVSYGGAVISAVLRLTGASWRAPLTRMAEGAAVCTVLVGAALIVPHIGRPDRLYELLTQPNVHAPVFWDFIAVSTYATASVVFFCLPLIPDAAALLDTDAARLGRPRRTLYRAVARGWTGTDPQRRSLHRALTLVSVMIVPLAVSVHSVLAWAFATTSRPWWHESIWAPQFVVAALYSGVALVILVVAAFRSGYHLQAFIGPRHFVRMGYLMVTLGAGYLYLTFADILPGAYVAEDSTTTVFAELLVGRLAAWFWLFVVLGAVVPIVLVALPWTRTVPGVVVAAGLVVPMMWVKRLLMVIGPASFDVVTGRFGAYHFTVVALGITAAGLAAVPLLLMLLFRVVPLLSVDEIEELGQEPAAAHEAAGPPRVRTPLSTGARTVGAGLLVVAAAGAAVVLPARPAAAAPAAAPRVKLTAVQDAHGLRITARVTDAKGAAAAGGNVVFSWTSTVFGVRSVPVGTVALGKAGTAVLDLGARDHGWRPTVDGPQEFTAAWTQQVGSSPVTASVNVDVRGARSAYTPAPREPLGGAADWLVRALALIVAAVWVTLASTVVRVLRATGRVRPARARVPARRPEQVANALPGNPSTTTAGSF